jgi:N-acetylmuramoyl-L-alanine amidase
MSDWYKNYLNEKLEKEAGRKENALAIILSFLSGVSAWFEAGAIKEYLDKVPDVSYEDFTEKINEFNHSNKSIDEIDKSDIMLAKQHMDQEDINAKQLTPSPDVDGEQDFDGLATRGENDLDFNGIVIHHSDSPRDTTTVEDVDRWHKENKDSKGRPWRGIGYNYFIDGQGVVHEGREKSIPGAHASGRNKTHIGICLAGYDEFTPAQIDAMKKLVTSICSQWDIDTIEGHHENCPGPGVIGEVQSLNSNLQKGIKFREQQKLSQQPI